MYRVGIWISLVVFLSSSFTDALAGIDEDRYEKEYVNSGPGAHELATWLLAQLRQSGQTMPSSNSIPISNGCRYSTGGTMKRNSELINSLLGLPKQVTNGRRK